MTRGKEYKSSSRIIQLEIGGSETLSRHYRRSLIGGKSRNVVFPFLKKSFIIEITTDLTQAFGCNQMGVKVLGCGIG